MAKKNTNKLLFIIPIIFIGIMFFIVTSVSPLIGIDNYEAVFNTNGSNINLLYLISRALNRCLKWNARVGEFIYFFLGPLPHIIHDILNTCFFVYFIWLIYKYATDYEDVKGKNFWWISLIVPALIFLFEPSLWDDFFWMADSCNHLWGLCILLTAFLPFRHFHFKTFEIKGAKLILYFMACFVAGTVSENIVPFILGLIVLILIYKYRKEHKIYFWSVMSFISFILGYLWLMLNSSTRVRYDHFQQLDWSLNTKNSYFLTFVKDYKYYFIIIAVLLLIYIIKCLVERKKQQKDLNIKKSFIYNISFYILSFTAFFVLTFSPYYITRALLIISFTSLTLIVYLINDLLNIRTYIPKILISIVSIIIIFIYSLHIRNIYISYNNYDKERNIFIENQLLDKQLNILIVPLYNDDVDTRLFMPVEFELCEQDIIRNKYNVDNNTEIICVNDYSTR